MSDTPEAKPDAKAATKPAGAVIIRPPSNIVPKPKPAPRQPPSPPSLIKNFTLRDVKLPRDEMISAINGTQSLPPEIKQLLVSMVNALDKEVSLTRTDVHGFASGTNITLHITVCKL